MNATALFDKIILHCTLYYYQRPLKRRRDASATINSTQMQCTGEKKSVSTRIPYREWGCGRGVRLHGSVGYGGGGWVNYTAVSVF